MTKEWCKQKEVEANIERKKSLNLLLTEIANSEYLSEQEKQTSLVYIKNQNFVSLKVYLRLATIGKGEKAIAWYYNDVLDLTNKAEHEPNYEYLADSEKVEFDGDILITDPCYFLTDEDEEKGAYRFGGDFSIIGIPHSMTRDTLYGDWSCTVVNTDTNKKLGEFCADGAAVSVVDLNELLAHNPTFDDYLAKPWAYTVIHDFKGTVQFVVKEDSYIYEDKQHYDYEVEVVGKGINKKTGESLNFHSFQSGF